MCGLDELVAGSCPLPNDIRRLWMILTDFVREAAWPCFEWIGQPAQSVARRPWKVFLDFVREAACELAAVPRVDGVSLLSLSQEQLRLHSPWRRGSRIRMH